MSIIDIKEKIKYHWQEKASSFVAKIREGIQIKNDLFVILIIVLVGLSGFGLGTLSALEKGRESVQIKPLDFNATALNSSQNNIDSSKKSLSVIPAQAGIQGGINGLVLAAKTGTKYYYPWCSGASRISEKNKVWFDTVEAAKAAGYSPASNCNGLK